ncbi:MAG: hypothetical protein KA174_09785 [Chitinophagales bacterium]|nr:hypothetical protein [Chitinophagales bacterium]
MTVVVKIKNAKKEIPIALKNLSKIKSTSKKVDLLQFCGTLNWKEDPMEYQKKARNEWS